VLDALPQRIIATAVDATVAPTADAIAATNYSARSSYQTRRWASIFRVQ